MRLGTGGRLAGSGIAKYGVADMQAGIVGFGDWKKRYLLLWGPVSQSQFNISLKSLI
jgi:hypothetical protein